MLKMMNTFGGHIYRKRFWSLRSLTPVEVAGSKKKLDLNWVKEKEIIEKSANKLIVLIEPGMQGLENILYSTYRHNTRGLSGFSLLKIRYGKRMKTELKTTCF